MKKLAAIVFLLILVTFTFGQIKDTAPTEARSDELLASAQAKEAFADFDFGKLSINPNNLTPENIEDLRRHFYAPVRPYVIDQGERVARLERIAKPIFLFHKAAKSQTVVFDYKQPTVFTWKETFVTFSTGALDLLTDDEAAALIAHEIGHLYFAAVLEKARREKNNRLTQVIELKCDLIALVTLSKLKINPSSLISAVKKLIERRSQLQTGSFEPGSPSLKSREEVLELYLRARKQ